MGFISPDISKGQEDMVKTVIGEIIEIAPDEYIIQVENRNYIVNAVFIDDGSTELPLPGVFHDLRVGSLVEIQVGNKKDGFWKAKQVTILRGDKKEKVLGELD
jgi:hypothetical protein